MKIVPSPFRIVGKSISRNVATVARRWIRDSPRSGDRSYGRNTEAIIPAILILIITVVLVEFAAGNEWEQAFSAGMIDRSTGKPIRGTEIVHLVAHKGRLYAGNGYWMDTRGYANIPWPR